MTAIVSLCDVDPDVGIFYKTACKTSAVGRRAGRVRFDSEIRGNTRISSDSVKFLSAYVRWGERRYDNKPSLSRLFSTLFRTWLFRGTNEQYGPESDLSPHCDVRYCESCQYGRVHNGEKGANIDKFVSICSKSDDHVERLLAKVETRRGRATRSSKVLHWCRFIPCPPTVSSDSTERHFLRHVVHFGRFC
jgi:hypothetical protein